MLSRRQIVQRLMVFGITATAPFQVSFGAAPPRVIAIDWAAAEALLALGITPLGVSDTHYYRTRMREPALPDEVIDVGPFWEINLELIDSLKPDFILATRTNLLTTPKLAQVARVEIVESVVASSDRYGLAEQILRQTGQFCGLPASVADGLIASADSRFQQLRHRLPGVSARPVMVILPDQSGRMTSIYGQGSLPAAVLTRLGLQSAWSGPVNAMGIARVGFEKLLAYPDAAILMIDIPTQRLQTQRALEDSILWQAVPAVRQGRCARIDQFYPFGGLPSALMMAETIVERFQEFSR